MKKLNNSLLLLLFLGTSFISKGQTCLPSVISSDLTLTKAGSPYEICNQTVITETGKLVIEPGVDLSSPDLGFLEVEGEISFNGSPSDSIFYDHNSSNPISISGNGKITMDYTRFLIGGSAQGISIEAENNHVITNSTFVGGGQAILAKDKGTLLVCSSLFKTRNGYGIEGVNISNMPTSTVSNNIFDGRFSAIFSNGDHDIHNNVIKNADSDWYEDIFAIKASGGSKIFNNSIENNKLGIFVDGDVTITHNDFKNNFNSLVFSQDVSLSTKLKIDENSFCENESNFANKPTNLNVETNCFCTDDSKTCVSGITSNVTCALRIVPTVNCLPNLILEPLVLTREGSPYTICETTTITETGSLTLEPGVELILEAKLNIEGDFNASGSLGDTVSIVANNFAGYFFLKKNSNVRLNYTKVNGSLQGEPGGTESQMAINNSRLIDMDLTGGYPIICNSILESCDLLFVGSLSNSIVKSSRITRSMKTSNCVFKESVVSAPDTVIGNTFENCSPAIELAEGTGQISNNTFRNNHVAIKRGASSSNLIIDNFFDQNQLAGFLPNGGSLNLASNCWSRPLSEVKFSITEIDSPIAADNQEFPSSLVNFLPVSSNCNTGYDPDFTDCSSTRDFTGVLLDPTFSITGLAHEGSELLNNGYAFLYSSIGTSYAPIATDTVVNGEFNFTKIDSGSYTILLVPTTTDYEPTFYVNKRSIKNAHLIQVRGDVSGVDVWLNEKVNQTDVGLNSYLLVLDNDDFNDGVYPVIFKIKSGGSYVQYFAAQGMVSNNTLELDLFGLLPQDYEVTIPRNGLEEYSFCLRYSGGEYIVDESCVTSGINDVVNEIQFSLAPNPVQNTVNVFIDFTGTYEVISSTGEIVLNGELTNSQTEISTDNLENGIYFLRVITQDGTNTKSFVNAN